MDASSLCKYLSVDRASPSETIRSNDRTFWYLQLLGDIRYTLSLYLVLIQINAIFEDRMGSL